MACETSTPVGKPLKTNLPTFRSSIAIRSANSRRSCSVPWIVAVKCPSNSLAACKTSSRFECRTRRVAGPKISSERSGSFRKVCASVSRPVNVVMGLKGTTFSTEELAAAGVKRISVGGAFARAALGAFVRAAREVKDKGTFTFAEDAMSHAEAGSYMANVKH